ncbi:MAG: Murein endolytic transglycosylase MltG [Rhodanobacteraceae bacterium]|nr:MAG: Murein endolytic transglycosylase MltG [Rhodanobacteraceae bacterium]
MTRRRKRQRGRLARPLAVLVLVIVLAIAAAAVWSGITYLHFTRTPLNVRTAGQTIEIAKGEGFKGIVVQLRNEKLSDASPLLWRALAMRLGVVDKLHAGEYALAPGMTPTVLLENMAAGRVLHRRVTLVDGWAFTQVRAALQKAPKLAHAIDKLSDAEVMAKLGDAEPSPEGEFMPDTYDYVLGMSDLDILARAHKAMQAFLAKEWAGRDPSVPLQTPYQALILASLVEKETAVPAERPEIAGVFERRLKLGMKLDTDPSVIFGMGSAYAGKIHKLDLETDTPYNTYTRAGLPPTPIALPSRAAIHAVLHPAPGDALYFVARGDGTHQFSATLAEHNAAVKKYILGKQNR